MRTHGKKPLGLNPIQHTGSWAIYVNQMSHLGYHVEFGQKTPVPEQDWSKTFGGKLRIRGAYLWA